MDPLALRLANRLLGNPESAAALEITMAGPTLRFNTATKVCLTGAEMSAELDGEKIHFWEAVSVQAGQVLRIGQARGAGCRAYLAVAGGLNVPEYLGSKSTFTLGKFGGHGGRALRVGDVIHYGDPSWVIGHSTLDEGRAALVGNLKQLYRHHANDQQPITNDKLWHLGVLYGPHGAPEFFTPEDIQMFFTHEWEVHYNSARTGVRLIGPKPKWARQDGGEAGLHPSNIHDNAYAIGAIDFTGDMPIILGPDGPSLGGFVCPAVVCHAELWKLGQLRPGDKVRFCQVTQEQARALEIQQDTAVATLSGAPSSELAFTVLEDIPVSTAAMKVVPAEGDCPEIVFRPAGDSYLLVEFGELALDIYLRFWVHAIYLQLRELEQPDIIDLTPGIRSLQIHFDSRKLSYSDIIGLILQARDSLPPVEEMEVPSRIVHLPLSWDDPATREAIEKYMHSVRADAPWCPSNIEFIRRINGLESIEEVQRIVFEASYLVLGLGDVYLGAPVATPLDPRHRLVTTKYNPARTWTPENAVGIGGAYMCVYGMEGPGGYQFVGRTVQMWNRHRTTASFEPGKPWLLRFFDQVRFYPVSAEELLTLRKDFPQGRFEPRIESTTFSLRDYQAFLAGEAESISSFKHTQRQAFEEERQRWVASGYNAAVVEEATNTGDAEAIVLRDDQEAVQSAVSGNLWKVMVSEGEEIQAGQAVAIVEAMKMEIQIQSPTSGRVSKLLGKAGQSVAPGQTLMVINR
jgi:urea carboxylase